MNKKKLSFMALAALTTSMVGGCGANNAESINKDVIKVGDQVYSADQLYKNLLSEKGNEAFTRVLRSVVESSLETTTNIKSAAELALETLNEEAETNAKANGTQTADELKKLLEEKGFSSADEYKADLIYKEKLRRLTDNYWQENKYSKYYNDYVEDRLPYLVRHVLVQIDDNVDSNRMATAFNMSEAEGKKLYEVIQMFKSGDKFAYIANQKTDDSGSASKGGAYYMDNTYGVNGFVDEFAYGVYAFDALTSKTAGVDESANPKVLSTYTFSADAESDKYKKLVAGGLTDSDTFNSYYENGFNFVDMKVVNMLGEVYDEISHYSGNNDYFTIDEYKADGNSNVLLDTTSLDGSTKLYARNILFNRAFNRPGVSVIGYNSIEEATEDGAKNVAKFVIGNQEKYILTDEEGNAIFFVAARGSSNALWVHFLTINVSSLSDLETAKKFFTIKTKKDNDQDTDTIASNPDDDFLTYVEMMRADTKTSSTNTIVKELESYIKSYATNGVGNNVGEEALLNYDMFEHYLAENEYEWANNELKTAILGYITNMRNKSDFNFSKSLVDDWNEHTDKLGMSVVLNPNNAKDLKPYECGVFIEGDAEIVNNPYSVMNYSSGRLCRYVYGKGYQVRFNYFYSTDSTTYTEITNTTTNRAAWFDKTVAGDDVTVDDYYHTVGADGSEKVYLFTPKVDDAHIFIGYYTDKALTKEVSHDETGYYVDLSKSDIDNKLIFFADIRPNVATAINYKYVDQDGNEIDDELFEIATTNPTSHQYDASKTSADNTFEVSKDNFTSPYVEAFVGIEKDNEFVDVYSRELTAQDVARPITLTVKVKLKRASVTYVAVNPDGTVNDDITISGRPTTVYFGHDFVNDNAGELAGTGYENYEIAGVSKTAGTEVATQFKVEGSDVGTESEAKQITVYVLLREVQA